VIETALAFARAIVTVSVAEPARPVRPAPAVADTRRYRARRRRSTEIDPCHANRARLIAHAAALAARKLGPPPASILRGGTHVAKPRRGTKAAKNRAAIREFAE